MTPQLIPTPVPDCPAVVVAADATDDIKLPSGPGFQDELPAAPLGESPQDKIQNSVKHNMGLPAELYDRPCYGPGRWPMIAPPFYGPKLSPSAVTELNDEIVALRDTRAAAHASKYSNDFIMWIRYKYSGNSPVTPSCWFIDLTPYRDLEVYAPVFPHGEDYVEFKRVRHSFSWRAMMAHKNATKLLRGSGGEELKIQRSSIFAVDVGKSCDHFLNCMHPHDRTQRQDPFASTPR